ncbi:MAG: DNA ligase, partial [Candidatus Thorarchaeota archaeon]
MLYEQLARAYDTIETSAGSIEKTNIFSELLQEAKPKEVGPIVALTIGKLHPDWMGLPEIGLAEKMAVQVLANAASASENEVLKVLRKTGDIGAAAEELLGKGGQQSLFPHEYSVTDVYKALDDISRTSGAGSTKEKVAKLVGLLSDSKPIEAKYILRTITGTLRLGLGIMGLMDALAVAYS